MVNQVIEYMLRMFVMEKLTQWEEYLHLVEFAYKKSVSIISKDEPI
jgi:hypothetical protein